MGITLFTTTKPFSGLAAIHQRNALLSWTKLTGEWELVLIGDDPGAEAFATQHGFIHHPHVERNARGTPLVSDLFRIAREIASHPTIAYANADILLLPDANRLPCHWESRRQRGALLTGRRHELRLDREIDFSNSDWESVLRAEIAARGCLDAETALDFFLFDKELFADFPPFAVGRPGWDNCLLALAAQKGLDVIDATPALTLIHPTHDYGHLPGGWLQAWHGEEAQRNRELIARELTTLSQAATHSLFPDGLRKGYAPPQGGPSRRAAFKIELGAELFSEGRTQEGQNCWLEAMSLAGVAIADSPRFAASETLNRALLGLAQERGGPLAMRDLISAAESAFGSWIAQRIDRQPGRALAVWGTGRAGRSIKGTLEGRKLRPACFLASTPVYGERSLEGLPIHSPEHLENPAAEKPFVVVASMFRNAIEARLRALGYEPELDFV